MTLGDLLKRVGTDEKAREKMLILTDGIGWCNIKIEECLGTIYIMPDKNNSPFSSDN